MHERLPDPESADLPTGIVDVHCHIASTRTTPPSFVRGVVANSTHWSARQRERIADLYLAQLQDHQCDRLVGEMDDAGIAHTVLLCADFTHALPDCGATIAELVQQHLEVLARHPGRFTTFVGVDPRWGADGVTVFERSLEHEGVRGFKVYPPCGFSPSDRGLYPFYELCASRGLPATVHMGPTSSALSFEHARPELIDQAARDFPQVNFILAHASVAYVRECVLMAAHRPNVYLDVSAYDAGTPEDLAFMLGRGITHKILFGTDWPVLMMRGTQREALARLCGPGGPAADLSEAESAFFFRENAERIIPGLSAVLAESESEAAVVESASHAG